MKETLINSVDKSVILELDNLKTTINPKTKITTKTDKKHITIINTHILEKRDVEKNSSFELDTWLQTSYNNVLLRIKNMDIRIIAVWIMSIISTVFATWIVADDYFEGYYREKFTKKANLIIPITNYIIRSCLLFLTIFLTL